jgi:DNA repair protein RecN (Recombination protein N)
MLTRLFIRDFALIEEVEIEFGSGLNIITGETGAGKSILLGALYSILGGQASADLVRDGAEKCIVEGLLEFDDDSRVVDHLQQLEVECEDGQLFLRREILKSGRSRAYVNGSGCPVKTLRQIGELLVDLHGQHEHQALLAPHLHIRYLDAFGKHEKLTKKTAQLWRAYRTSLRAINELQRERAELVAGEELRAFQLGEIRELAPQPGEETALETELQILDNAHNLLQMGEELHDLLYQREGSVYEQLGQVRRLLDRILEIDLSLGARAADLEQITYSVEDLAGSLRDYGRGMDTDPARAEAVRERLDALRALKRKYGNTLEAVLTYCDQLEQSENHSAELNAQIAEALRQHDDIRAQFAASCTDLSAAREKTARALEKAVGKSLVQLGMEHGVFRVHIERQIDDNGLVEYEGLRFQASEQGLEAISFHISTNIGQEPRPLARIASGGEVSRIMLAIKEAIAERDLVPVLVFDEIDAGISGRIAAAVGRKLQGLSSSHQTIAITHLPQIASLAEHHFSVRKEAAGKRTTTRVARLDEAGRTEEIAHLIAGETVSDTAREHARDMLK